MSRNIKEHQKFFNHHAVDWDDDYSLEKIERIKNILSNSEIEYQGKILDVGCGTGILIPILKEISAPDSTIFELDFALEMLEKNKYKKENKNPNIFRINSDVHTLPFADHSFDLAICFATLPHFWDKQKALMEIYRILSNQGYLVILHLMSSTQLNQLHASTGEIIKKDRMQPIPILSKYLEEIENDKKAANNISRH